MNTGISRLFLSLLLTIAFIFSPTLEALDAVKTPQPTRIPGQALPENTLAGHDILQFTAGGHILGFKPDRVYFASLGHAIIEEFVGTEGVMPAGEAGKGKTKGMKGAPPLGKVIYKNLWQGITLKYEAKAGGIAESSFTLEPYADVKNIKLRYNVSVGIEKDGSLRFRHPSERGYFSQSAPKAWQDIEGKRMPVVVAFTDYDKNTIGYRLGAYNRQYPVVIDPTSQWSTLYYQWHTFYGSAGYDGGFAIATDTNNDVYVTGYSSAAWNGPSGQAPLHAFSGSYDIVVLKLNSAGAYQWHTFYGSTGNGYGTGIATDTSNNVYVTGEVNATWNGPSGQAPLNVFSGNTDIFVLKLNSAGLYQWHTFYGSAGDYGTGNAAYGIAIDIDGNAYVTGYSTAAWNGPSGQAPLHAFSGSYDIFVLKLNSAGAYQWHTFYGSAGSDDGYDIALDTNGNAYVTGVSIAVWNGPSGQAPLHAFSGSYDIFVLKLNSAGAYQWHTFYGSTGSGSNVGKGIAIDTNSNVYVTGKSAATWGSPLNLYSGGDDIVVLKLNSAGTYQWHTFYGSAGDDYGNGIAIDTNNNVYVTGKSTATWGSPLNAYSGGGDIVVLKLNSSGAHQWHAFYGSAGDDIGNGIAADTNSNVYVTGGSNAAWGLPLNAYSANLDIAVLKLFDTSSCAYTISPTSQSFTSAGGTGSVSVTASSGSCTWTATSSLSWVATIMLDSGTGSGTAGFTVSANTLGSGQRIGNITIAGQTFVITQSDTAFADVLSTNVFYSYINAIYNAHITVGCSQNPLMYCPDTGVTRGQMAAFIIRAKYGENFTYTQTPYFSDVPATNVFFKYVQKMKDDAITTVTGTYGVNDVVTRGQMAAFIIRAKYGENFTYTQTPYFSDVPATNVFFKYVQKLKDDNITALTGTYYVDAVVTRGQMAAFIARAFLNMP